MQLTLQTRNADETHMVKNQIIYPYTSYIYFDATTFTWNEIFWSDTSNAAYEFCHEIKPLSQTYLRPRWFIFYGATTALVTP